MPRDLSKRNKIVNLIDVIYVVLALIIFLALFGALIFVLLIDYKEERKSTEDNLNKSIRLTNKRKDL